MELFDNYKDAKNKLLYHFNVRDGDRNQFFDIIKCYSKYHWTIIDKKYTNGKIIKYIGYSSQSLPNEIILENCEDYLELANINSYENKDDMLFFNYEWNDQIEASIFDKNLEIKGNINAL